MWVAPYGQGVTVAKRSEQGEVGGGRGCGWGQVTLGHVEGDENNVKWGPESQLPSGVAVWLNEIVNTGDVTFNKRSACISHHSRGGG